MKVNLEGLNPNQREAVEWDRGPLLVLAGPGSGKTRVLTMRVAKLLTESPAKRFRVLGVTFTNKAAAEMRSRVEMVAPEFVERALLTTFHSFCADILRQHGSHVGLRPDFTILSQDEDRQAVLADAIASLESASVDVSTDDVRLLPVIDRLLSNLVPVDQVSPQFDDSDLGQRVSALFSEYLKQLIANNRSDFTCLLYFAYQLLVGRPAIAKQVRTVYPHICVDEFQDTNLAQYKLLRAIVGEDPQNLFVVADDDQIIYQWNGASPERLKELRDDYKMAVIQLPANYRCPPQVIGIANQLIRHNLDRTPDKVPLYAVKPKGSGEAIRLEAFDTVENEMEWVASDIALQHRGDCGSCAVLARTRKLAELSCEQLKNQGLNASLAVRKNEFVSAPFRWLHATLRLANARSDREQVRRMCKAFFEIEGVNLDVQDVTADSAVMGGDLLRSWFHRALANPRIEDITRSFLHKAHAQIVDRLEFLPFIQCALAWFQEQDHRLSQAPHEGFADYAEEMAGWEELQHSACTKYGNDLSLNTMLQEFDLSEKSPPMPDDAVRCLTIHSSKGLEFRHVYLVGLAEDQLPSFQSIKKGPDSREMREERRNCFVAITRAEESLTMTYALQYFGYPKMPSRFLREMGLV